MLPFLKFNLKTPKKKRFFKKLSLKLVSSFPLTNRQNTKKDFPSNPPKKRKTLKKKDFKKERL
ncbi:hypothetical protein D2C81_03770 [Helicobacter pylori]|nr:hypothetical protein D2C81_03770 [Helicobacter pylori]